MKRGAKKQSAKVLELRGTTRKDRPREAPVTHLKGAARKPKWLNGLASDIWNEKMAVFNDRKQSVRGCESTLAQYCAMQAALIGYWTNGEVAPTNLINAHRIYANEFWDTPASQLQAPDLSDDSDNPFASHGKPK